MKTPSDLLKQGIEEGNWTYICTAYEILSGNELSSPVKQTTVNIENIPDILKECATVLSGTKTKATTKTKSKAKVIKNTDSMTFITKEDYTQKEKDELIKNAIKYDLIEKPGTHTLEELQDFERQINHIKNDKVKKEPRKPQKPWQVECSVCHQEFTSKDRPDSFFGQKCSKCMNSMISN